mmetsp:Transcript_27918/g.59318  ORF Transcript_27918/g.59318 Transcript_27918/m.59318 type:complete len:217 (-) Transcript_27918:1672-2322(-)
MEAKCHLLPIHLHLLRHSCRARERPQRPQHPSCACNRPYGRRCRVNQVHHIGILLPPRQWRPHHTPPPVRCMPRPQPPEGPLVLNPPCRGALPFPPPVPRCKTPDVSGSRRVSEECVAAICNGRLHGLCGVHVVEHISRHVSGCGSSTFRRAKGCGSFSGVVDEPGPLISVDLPNGQEGLGHAHCLGSKLHRDPEVPRHLCYGVPIRSEPARARDV